MQIFQEFPYSVFLHIDIHLYDNKYIDIRQYDFLFCNFLEKKGTDLGFSLQKKNGMGIRFCIFYSVYLGAFPSISFRVRLLQITLPLHCFRSDLLHFSNGFAVLRILNAKIHLPSLAITYPKTSFQHSEMIFLLQF